MSDTSSTNPAPRAAGAVAGKLAIGVALAVLVISAIVLSIVWWDVVNPIRWSNAVWSAVGTWLASLATVGAVVVALYQSRQARVDAKHAIDEARRQHKEQLRHEIHQADGASVSAILVSLDELVRAMRRADRDVETFRTHRMEIENSEIAVPDEDPDYHESWKKFLRTHLAPVRNVRSGLINTRDSVQTPELAGALTDAIARVQTIGDQIYAWSDDAGNYRDLGPLKQSAEVMPPGGHTRGVLEGMAARTQEVVREALRKDPNPDLWPDSAQADATPNI